MKRWLAVSVLAFALAVSSASVGAAGEGDEGRGLDRACSNGSVSEKNPNCRPGHPSPGQGHGRAGEPPNTAGPSPVERAAGCVDDVDGDAAPDGCDLRDQDNDGIPQQFDNCPGVANNDQSDVDRDNVGDRCDPHPEDADHDGVRDAQDNCPGARNPDQRDADDDGTGDPCDGDDGGDSGRENRIPDDAEAALRHLRATVNDTADTIVAGLPQP